MGRVLLVVVLLLALGLGAAWLAAPEVMEGALNTALDAIMDGNGKRVTNAPADAAGVVNADPAELARKAGVDVQTYALARAVRSERGGLPRAAALAIAFAIANEARRRGKTILELVTGGKTHAGKFGAQNLGGRYCSTRVDPYEQDIQIAAAVRSGAPDTTGGATMWDSPAAQRAMLAKKAKGYRKTPEDVAAARRAAGMELVLVDGVAEEKFRLWRAA